MQQTGKTAVSIALTLAIFAFDILTPQELADWALYIIPILIAAPALTRFTVFLFPFADTVLIVVDFFLSPPAGNPVTQIINRGIGIFVLWTVSVVISHRKRAEEALERSYRELEQRVADRTSELKKTMEELARSNKELEHFAYAVSHDLQEPLRSVSSFVGLLAEKYKGKLDERADKYIAYTTRGAKRMAALIDDLLLYARVGTQGKLFENVDLAAAVETAIENLKQSLAENNASITRDHLPVITGDETQLVQLIQNLIGNAIKFRKKNEPPRIHVSARRSGREWVVGVHDNGIGIDPGSSERIFTIFQRLHTAEEYPGTGIGLAICKRIVERHEGRIWVESKPGQGSTFYFTLPVLPATNVS